MLNLSVKTYSKIATAVLAICSTTAFADYKPYQPFTADDAFHKSTQDRIIAQSDKLTSAGLLSEIKWTTVNEATEGPIVTSANTKRAIDTMITNLENIDFQWLIDNKRLEEALFLQNTEVFTELMRRNLAKATLPENIKDKIAYKYAYLDVTGDGMDELIIAIDTLKQLTIKEQFSTTIDLASGQYARSVDVIPTFFFQKDEGGNMTYAGTSIVPPTHVYKDSKTTQIIFWGQVCPTKSNDGRLVNMFYRASNSLDEIKEGGE